MTIVEPGTRTPSTSAPLAPELEAAIREYLRTYVLWRGIKQATATFGVSRHTLWRFLERGHTSRALPRAVLDIVGDSVEVLEAATWAIPAVERLVASRPVQKPVPSPRPLRQALEDTLLLLCATPLATVDELSRFGRVPASTIRDRLKKLAKMGMVDSVHHHLTILGPHSHLRYFPTEMGIAAGSMVEHGTETFLREYPVSRQWFRLLADRLDAVAMLYRAAALVADADSQGKPVRVDHYRQGPYDMLITLSQGRSVGLLRQGPTLPSANLRYRLRTMENLPFDQRPMETLVLAFSDQANRRAVRTLGDPQHHHRTFVTTEGELLAGDHRGVVWQQCGKGTELDLPVKVDPDVSLENIIAQTDWLAEWFDDLRLRHNRGAERELRPDPETLYPSHLRGAMPEPSETLRSSLAVQLTGAEKDALDLLAAWPLCTTDQLAGLMGGITRRRANQVLNSLAGHSLMFTDGQRHAVTDEGLSYLARRDRAAVGPVLGRWSARKRRRRNARTPVYAGTALRSIASQMEHHDAITGFAAMLTAEAARSNNHDYEVFDLMPTSRSSVGYRWDWTNYVVHPDASFQLAYQGRFRFYLLEFERRATTPRRVRTRLGNYRRYFDSGWPNRDHGGLPPWCCLCYRPLTPRRASCELPGTHAIPSCSRPTSRPWTSVVYWATHGNCRRLTLPDGGHWPQLQLLQNDNSPSPGLPVGGVYTKLSHLLPTLSGPKRPKLWQLVAETKTMPAQGDPGNADPGLTAARSLTCVTCQG